MFVYALIEPIDTFDGLTPLPEWIVADPAHRTRWALQALLALADTATQVRWDGDLRHLPSVGAVLARPAPAHTSSSNRTTTAPRSSSPTSNCRCPRISSNGASKPPNGASARGPTPPSPRSTSQPLTTSEPSRRRPIRPLTSATHRSSRTRVRGLGTGTIAAHQGASVCS